MGQSRASVCRAFLAVLSICTLSLSAKALADPVAVELPPQPMASALREFARQTGIQVAIPAELTDGKISAAVKGKFEPADALNRLLKGSGLIAYPVNGNTYGIRSESIAGRNQGVSVRPIADRDSPTDQPRLAQGSPTSADPSTPETQGSNAPTRPTRETPSLTEIIVTAEKRSERLQEVPVPVTVISGDSLVEINHVRIQDYALTVPGFSASGQNGFYQNLSIRGITTGTANPTVGIMIDDAPFGSSSIDGGGLFVPDIDPSDLARVEVLRGPQGTLYGASSMGGLVKFVTIDPSTSETSGRLSVGTSSISNGSELGYNARGSVNVPLSETWAVRLSGFTREDPGFIDDPTLHRDGVNKTDAYGGRLSALWRPTDGLSLKLSALYQDVKIGGDNNVEVASGIASYDQVEVPGAGQSDMQVQVYSATVTAKLGAADLTAISGYNVNSSLFSQDYSAIVGGLQPFSSVSGARLDLDMRNAKFTQEIRLAMPLGQVADWLLGAFYSHEHTRYDQNLYAEDATTGNIAGQWVLFSVPQTYTEYSGFTDFTFHLTERFDVQLGARESEIRQTSSESQIGAPYANLIGSPNPVLYPAVDSSVNAFTYLLTPRLKLSPDWMAYARLASGYRPGGPNVTPGVPPQYQPDKTQNYEVGLKGDTWNHKIQFDGSLYYIDWKNIQLTLLDPQNYQGYTANASRAKSQGVELSLNVTPTTGLTIAGWVAWNTAVLKEGFTYSGMLYEAYGTAGDRLPFGSRFSGNLSVNEEFRITAQWKGTVGVSESYVGDQVGGFQDATTVGIAPPRQHYPSYARTDLRAGLKYDSWRVNLFANNVTNRRAVIPLGGLDASPLPQNYFTVIQPRLIGININKTF